MKKIIAISSLLCLATTICLAQQKKLQVAFNTNLVDANIATELGLSKKQQMWLDEPLFSLLITYYITSIYQID